MKNLNRLNIKLLMSVSIIIENFFKENKSFESKTEKELITIMKKLNENLLSEVNKKKKLVIIEQKHLLEILYSILQNKNIYIQLIGYRMFLDLIEDLEINLEFIPFGIIKNIINQYFSIRDLIKNCNYYSLFENRFSSIFFRVLNNCNLTHLQYSEIWNIALAIKIKDQGFFNDVSFISIK